MGTVQSGHWVVWISFCPMFETMCLHSWERVSRPKSGKHICTRTTRRMAEQRESRLSIVSTGTQVLQANQTSSLGLTFFSYQAWFHGEGLELPVKMEYDSSLAESAYKLAERWDSSRSVEVTQLQFTENDLEHFSSTQKGSILTMIVLSIY